MKALKLLALAAAMTFAFAAFADDEEQQEMKIVVAGAIPEESAAIHWISSGDAGLDIQNMQIGESQSIIDESGRAVLITREENGFKFDVDGQTIVMPDFGDVGALENYVTFGDGSDFTANVDVEIVGEHRAISAFATPAFGNGGVTIISDEPLDAMTKESIKAVLQSAGRDDEVTFIDHSGGSDGGQIKMIRKQVEVTQ
jgi:hypothetical protein